MTKDIKQAATESNNKKAKKQATHQPSWAEAVAAVKRNQQNSSRQTQFSSTQHALAEQDTNINNQNNATTMMMIPTTTSYTSGSTATTKAHNRGEDAAVTSDTNNIPSALITSTTSSHINTDVSFTNNNDNEDDDSDFDPYDQDAKTSDDEDLKDDNNPFESNSKTNLDDDETDEQIFDSAEDLQQEYEARENFLENNTKTENNSFLDFMKSFNMEGLTNDVLTKFKHFYMASSLKDRSKKQYRNNRRSVEKRGYDFTVGGLLMLMMSDDPKDTNLSNQSLECILSSYRHEYFCTNLAPLPMNFNVLLTKAMAVRRRKHPDNKRVTGAMTYERTQVFLKWIAQRQNLRQTEKNILHDVVWMLYACALRVFQLESLQVNSFYRVEVDREIEEEEGKKIRKRVKELYIKVIAKGGEKNQRMFEKKQVDPKLQKTIEEIIHRRSQGATAPNTKLFADFSSNLRSTLGKLIAEAAIFFKFPNALRYRVHSFRHGAAHDAFIEGGCSLLAVRLRTGHLSETAAQHYARSDLERTNAASGTGKGAAERIASKILATAEECKKQLKGKLVKKNELSPNILNKAKNLHADAAPKEEEQAGSDSDSDKEDLTEEFGATSEDIEPNLDPNTSESSRRTRNNNNSNNNNTSIFIHSIMKDIPRIANQVVILPQFHREPMQVIDGNRRSWLLEPEELNNKGVFYKPNYSNEDLAKIQLLVQEKIQRMLAKTNL